MMPDLQTAMDEDWAELSRRFHRRPLLGGAPKVAVSFHEVEIRRGWIRWAIIALVGGLAATCLYVFLRALSWSFSPESVSFQAGAFGFLGLGLLLISVRASLSRARICWKPEGRYFSVTHGFIPFAQTIDLPRESLRVLFKPADCLDDDSYAETLLLLRRQGHPGQISLAIGSRAALFEAYEALRQFLPCVVIHETLELRGTPPAAVIELPHGRTITVSRSPVGFSVAPFRTRRFMYRSPDQADLVPTLTTRLIYAVPLVIGLFAGLPLVSSVIESPSLTGIILAAVAGPLLILVGFVGMVDGFGPRRVIADRLTRTLRIKPGILKWHNGEQSIPLENVVAVQICSRTYFDEYFVYEANLVLKDPAGQRSTLMSHAMLPELRDDAGALATFIEKPLLVHG